MPQVSRAFLVAFIESGSEYDLPSLPPLAKMTEPRNPRAGFFFCPLFYRSDK